MVENWLNSIGWLLSVVTAIGNAFVVLLIAKNRRLHSPANWFVLSVAVADFAVGVAVFPSSYFCSFSVVCNVRIYVAFYWFFLHCSVTNLCTLTWDRYIAIVQPLRYNTSITKRRPGIVILTAWLIPFAISLSLLVGMYATNSITAQNAFRLVGVSAFDIISCVLLFYAVVRILVVARAQSHQEAAIELQLQPSHSPLKLQLNSRRRRRQNTATFTISIVVLFLGCYIVVNWLVLCSIIISCQVPNRAGQIVSILLVLNSAVNPLVYAFLKKDIKMEIRKLICNENLSED
ncbi:LOW QUALITY PROTEIN: alpha-2C adrenergic receptor-like [Oculina patagonica]